MSQRSNVNLNNMLSVKLLELRRHLMKCDHCRNAMSVHDHDLLCQYTKLAIMFIASKWDTSIAMRLRAKRSEDPFIYPCPDPNKHGSAYALTAEPIYISYVQPALF